MPPTPADILAFSSFRLDLRSGRLLRKDRAIPLRPKTWAVLLYLAERPGALVTKDDLLDAVWPDVAVTPDTLTKSIGELREALGDDSKTPRYIETVHRRGFRFIAEPEIDSRSEVAPRAGGPNQLVGRDAELGQLHEAMAEAAAGRRQIAFISGEAGIGKTALVNAFLRAVDAAARPLMVGRGTCFEQYAAPEPYMPVLDAIERLAYGPAGEEVLGHLRRVAPTWLAQMPWLTGAPSTALDGAARGSRSEHVLREFAALTEALTRTMPLVLILEDLHWCDPSTVDLLSFLGGRREPARLLIVGTYRRADAAVRDHPLRRAARSLCLHRQAVDVPLHELTHEDVRAYLELRFPAAPFAADLAPVIREYTDGTPLFMVAVIDHLVSRGSILETSPGWALVVAPVLAELPIPEEAQQLIQLQLDGLAPAERAVVEAASVAGSDFSVSVLAAAINADAESVESCCEMLAQGRRLLRGAGIFPSSDAGGPSRRYTFVHQLYRQASYAQIDANRRQRLHLRIGEALESAAGEHADAIAPELATHFGAAGDHARELHYLAAAAATARRRFANREAVDFLNAAIAAAALLPADRRESAELELRIQLAAPLADLFGFASDEVLGNAERAHALCREVGSDAQLFQVVYGLVHLHTARATPGLAEKVAAEMDDLARRLATPEHRLLADSALLRVALNGGDCVEACRLGALIDAAYGDDSALAPTGFGPDPLVAARAQYAVASWMVGESEESRSIMSSARQAAERTNSPFTQANVTCFAAMHAVLMRNANDAFDFGERSHSIACTHGLSQWIAPSLGFRGWARFQRGEREQGTADLEEARRGMVSAKFLTCFGSIASLLGEVHLQTGSLAAGLAAIEEGLAVAESTRDRLFWPELWRLKGEFLLAEDTAPMLGATGTRGRRRRGKATGTQRDDAEQCLQQAIELAATSGKQSLALRAATSLARAWQTAGRDADARSLLQQHCAGLAADPGNADLQEASDLLASLAQRRRSKVTGSA